MADDRIALFAPVQAPRSISQSGLTAAIRSVAACSYKSCSIRDTDGP